MSYQNPDPQQSIPREPVRLKLAGTRPIVTYVLMGITVLVFGLQSMSSGWLGYDLPLLLGAKFNAAIAKGEIWRLFTAAFLHGSVLHLFFNMYALYVIGRRLERFYGHLNFLLLYFVSAFAGNVLSFVLSPNPQIPSLGASTAIFGLFAAEGIFIIQNRKLFGSNQTRQMISNLAIVLLINLAYGFTATNIDNMGHIGGLLGGIFFAWQGGPKLVLRGEPALLEIVNIRKMSQSWLAALIVMIGFTIIAFIPTLVR